MQRIGDGVCQTIVNSRKTSGIGVTNPSDTNRSGSSGHNIQTGACRMTPQFDENVDLVRADDVADGV